MATCSLGGKSSYTPKAFCSNTWVSVLRVFLGSGNVLSLWLRQQGSLWGLTPWQPPNNVGWKLMNKTPVPLHLCGEIFRCVNTVSHRIPPRFSPSCLKQHLLIHMSLIGFLLSLSRLPTHYHASWHCLTNKPLQPKIPRSTFEKWNEDSYWTLTETEIGP